MTLEVLYRDTFRTAKVVYLASTAPKDGTPIIARNADGEIDLIRWRCGSDAEEVGGETYWARFTTDEEFDFVDWLPSPLSMGDILMIYG